MIRDVYCRGKRYRATSLRLPSLNESLADLKEREEAISDDERVASEGLKDEVGVRRGDKLQDTVESDGGGERELEPPLESEANPAEQRPFVRSFPPLSLLVAQRGARSRIIPTFKLSLVRLDS